MIADGTANSNPQEAYEHKAAFPQAREKPQRCLSIWQILAKSGISQFPPRRLGLMNWKFGGGGALSFTLHKS